MCYLRNQPCCSHGEKTPLKNDNKNRKQQKQRMMFFLPLQEMTLFIDTCFTV